jgi:Alginate lyase
MRRQLRRQDERTPLTDPAGKSPGPGRSRRARRGGWPIVVAAVGILVVVGGLVAWRSDRLAALGSLFAPAPTPTAAILLPPRRSGFLVDRTELERRAALAAKGAEPYRSAADDLMAWADRRVDDKPRPSERLRIPGTEGPFVDDTASAYGLALAWVVSGESRFAEASAGLIRAWVDTTTSTADTCPDDGACQTSLIIGRAAPGFVFAADLLHGSPFFDSTDEGAFRIWIRDVILPTASRLDNNWGDAGTFMRIAMTDYLGDGNGYEAALAEWRRLMDLVADDGHIPLEVARGDSGLGYTQEALDYKVAAAVIADRRGVDLWSYRGAGGGSLKEAVDYLARYMEDDAAWPWTEDVRRRGPSPMWELAYARWQDPAYVPLVAERRPFGEVGHSAVRWTTLTNGIPLDEP